MTASEKNNVVVTESAKKSSTDVNDVDLTKLMVEAVDGTSSEVDLSKDVAGMMYNRAQSIEVAIAAQDLFKTGKLTLTDVTRQACLESITGMYYCFRTAVQKALDK